MRLALGEIVAGILLAALAGWFIFQASTFPKSLNEMDVGPAVFPQIIAAVIIVFSLILVMQGVKKLSSLDKIEFKRTKPLVLSIILIIIYALIIPFVGYYIATAFYIAALLFLAGSKKWLGYILIIGGFLIFAKAGFEMLLKVPLP